MTSYNDLSMHKLLDILLLDRNRSTLTLNLLIKAVGIMRMCGTADVANRCRFRDFSLPGIFAPQSESSQSVPGTFIPGSECSLECSTE